MKKTIPHLITLSNLLCGFIAIVFAFDGRYFYALLCIVGAMGLDAMDGRAARLLNVEGDFGKELDSLADVVTFGVAPTLLLYNVSLYEWGTPGILFASLFPICGALRLARFNTQTKKAIKSFVGLPITAAGGILALFAVNSHFFGTPFMLVLYLSLNFLMVSTLKFPSFKHVRFPRHVYIVVPLMIILIYGVTQLTEDRTILLWLMPIPLCILFLLSVLKRRKRKAIEREKQEEQETFTQNR